MGNRFCKPGGCFSGSLISRNDVTVVVSEPLDEGLGHSFCYVRPDSLRFSSSKVHSEEDTSITNIFRTISGASVSANTSTPPLTSINNSYPASAFESSISFSSIPLQPVPKYVPKSRSLRRKFSSFRSPGTIEKGLISSPIGRGFMSGPIERGMFSGPIERGSEQLRRSFSHGYSMKLKSKKDSMIQVLRKVIGNKTVGRQDSTVAPVKGSNSLKDVPHENANANSVNLSSDFSTDDGYSIETLNIEWANGKAGEDRVQVVISEEHGWVFVGIYDGFNGPDAPDYLLSNLYLNVHKELQRLWEDDRFDLDKSVVTDQNEQSEDSINDNELETAKWRNQMVETCSNCDEVESFPPRIDVNSKQNSWNNRKNPNTDFQSTSRKGEENQRRWNCDWDQQRLDLDQRLKDQLGCTGSDRTINHFDVLKALYQALKKTEESYFEAADKMFDENPELALMGSCVLVMLMKGENVYVMNVGDSRAILAQKDEPQGWGSLERIREENCHKNKSFHLNPLQKFPTLSALQLTSDHSTNVEEEVRKIRREHPDDSLAITNGRVKGSLKVTRAFGAGFLKEPKWNNALLEAFRINYIGKSSYITCIPSLYHHRLGPRDKFLILSSDGLYQYFTNEEAVAEVERFISTSAEGDPAQHLAEEVLFRAAKNAGMDFHELLEIPQGDRRKYHDDVSIIVISLEGRIWRSFM